MSHLTVVRSKEAIIKSEAINRLEKLFSKAKQKPLLDRMIKGDLFEQWVDLTAYEMSCLRQQGMSNRALKFFLDETTKSYADVYLRTIIAMSGETVQTLDKKE